MYINKIAQIYTVFRIYLYEWVQDHVQKLCNQERTVAHWRNERSMCVTGMAWRGVGLTMQVRFGS